MKMKTEWIKGVPPHEVEERKKIVASHKIVLDILQEMCYNRLRELESVSQVDYNNPSWSHLQAHNNGMREAYRKIMEICTID